MALRWVSLASLGSLILAACGSSSDDGDGGGSAGSAGAGQSGSAGSAGAASGGSAGSGGAQGGSAGSAGSAGSGGGYPYASCMERTTNHVADARIRPRYAVTSEGDRSWQGWYDSERDEECRFTFTSNGKQHCLPSTAVAVTSYFTSSDCTGEVVRFDGEDCLTYEYVVKREGPACEQSSRVYEIGAEATAPATLYARDADGACVATTATGPFYALGAEIPLTSFAEGSSVTWPGSSRVLASGVETAAGLMQVQSWSDKDFGANCFFETGADAMERCMPGGGLYDSGLYADAACTGQTLFSAFGSSCPGAEPLAFGTQTEQEGCSMARRVYERGAEHTGEVYTDYPACTLSTPEPESRFFAKGAEVPASDFVAVEVVVGESDPGRLKPAYRTSNEGYCSFDGWYDSELDVRCQFGQGTDGELYCIPEAIEPAISLTFSDDACTVEAAVMLATECIIAATPSYVSKTDYETCGSPVEVWAVGALVAGADLPPLWELSGTTCVPATLSASAQFFQLGAKLPEATFVAAELMVE